MNEGPIEIVNLGGNENPQYPQRPKYEFDHFEFTLKVRVTTNGEPKFTIEELQKLQEVLTYWKEGRYNFASEMLATGLSDALKQVITQTFFQRGKQIHGKDMQQYADGATSKAYLYQQEQTKEFNFVDVDLSRISVQHIRKLTDQEFYHAE